MIRKLKIRLIALSMSALVVLLALIVAGMNLISYNALVQEADNTLSILSQNKGHFPDQKKHRKRERIPVPCPMLLLRNCLMNPDTFQWC